MVVQNETSPGRGGAIITMSSVNGVTAIPTIASYNASKGGIENLTRRVPLHLPQMADSVPASSSMIYFNPALSAAHQGLQISARVAEMMRAVPQVHVAGAGGAWHPCQCCWPWQHHDGGAAEGGQ